MDEYFFARFTRNKSEAFCFVEPFDCSFFQGSAPYYDFISATGGRGHVQTSDKSLGRAKKKCNPVHSKHQGCDLCRSATSSRRNNEWTELRETGLPKNVPKVYTIELQFMIRLFLDKCNCWSVKSLVQQPRLSERAEGDAAWYGRLPPPFHSRRGEHSCASVEYWFGKGSYQDLLRQERYASPLPCRSPQ